MDNGSPSNPPYKNTPNPPYKRNVFLGEFFYGLLKSFSMQNYHMPNYRRVWIKGSTLFITIVTYDRMSILLNPQSRKILKLAWKDVAKRYPFTTDAICLLPNHIHVLMTLPEHDCDYSMRIREIKRLYTK